jgi:DNA-binding transcriptional ArsR family regulator
MQRGGYSPASVAGAPASSTPLLHYSTARYSKKFRLRRLNRLLSILNQMVKYPAKTLNRTFAALADPTRRRILAHLARGDRCVTDLARPYSMSLPAVSKHLRVLEKAGLIRRRRHGRIHQVKLEAEPLKRAAQWVEEYRQFWEGSLDRLAKYLESANKVAGNKGKT